MKPINFGFWMIPEEIVISTKLLLATSSGHSESRDPLLVNFPFSFSTLSDFTEKWKINLHKNTLKIKLSGAPKWTIFHGSNCANDDHNK